MKKTDTSPNPEPGIVFDDDLDFVIEAESETLLKPEVESPKDNLAADDADDLEFALDGEVLEQESQPNSRELDVVSSGLSEKVSSGRIGDKLIEKGLITPDQLNVALQEKKQSSKMLGEILVDLGFIEADTLSLFLAESSGFSVFDPTNTIIDSEALELVDKNMAHKHSMLPFALSEGELQVAMADPYDVVAIDMLKRQIPKGTKVVPCVTTARTLSDAIDAAYGYAGSVKAILKELEAQSAEELDEVAGLSEDEAYSHPLVRLVNALVFDAVKAGVSDLHFEPEENFVRLRCRKDGVMSTTQILHKKHWNGISQRLKIMASLNIADKLAPQDGRIQMNIKGHEVDFRVSSLPTVHGENIVMRVLDKQSSIMPLSKLGFSEVNKERIKQAQSRPEGIIIVTGPTGSGKTTSLYSMLNEINTVDVNIQTLEDPVEYSLPMIRQTPVREGVLDFADGIRALLRQDPDIIFIGEIRDQTTAEMALQAAMTGHQVYTTLHTNDSFGAIPRLFDLGMVPGMIAGNIVSVFAQRLARTLCDNCKESYVPTDEEMALLDVSGGTPEIFGARQGGCQACAGQGYKGRVAVAEILLFDEEMDQILANGGNKAELKRVAVSKGFKSMKDDAMLKILEGRTTFEAVSKVVHVAK
jgi:general secretion pathway protein E/type IV pilus assembly protein PilB